MLIIIQNNTKSRFIRNELQAKNESQAKNE